MNKKEFISAVAGYVDKYASAYGILVHSSVIAQAILESGWVTDNFFPYPIILDTEFCTRHKPVFCR